MMSDLNPNPYESPQVVEERPYASAEQPRSSWWPKITVVELLILMAIFGLQLSIIHQDHRPTRSALRAWIGVGEAAGTTLGVLIVLLILKFVVDRLAEVWMRKLPVS